MIILEYKQQCSRSRHNSNKYADYFYLRATDRSPCFFTGVWELPENHLFTAYRAEYDKYVHLQALKFFICKVGGEKEKIICRKNSFNLADIKEEEDVSAYYVMGNFEVICAGIGLTYAKRLIEWWKAGDGSIAYAELCAKYLKPRIKEIPKFELDQLAEPKPQPTDAVLGRKDTAFQKWLSTAAVLGGKPK